MRAPFTALLLLLAAAAPAASAALPETGCPGSWTGAGEATFYDAFAQANACSLPISPGQHVVAVAQADFDGSAVCGRCLEIQGPLGSVVALVTDYCVGSGCRQLDLDPDSFAAIGNPTDGIIPVSWQSVSCDVSGPIAFYFDPGSNPYYAKIQVRNHRSGVAGVALDTGAAFTDLPRSIDNAFEFTSGSPIASPLSLRVSNVHGEVLDEPGIPYSIGAEVPGSGQFTPCPEPGAVAAAVAATLGLIAGRRGR